MNRKTQVVIRVTVGLILIGLTVRVLLVASETTTGYSFLGDQCERGTLGWFIDTEPISDKPFSEQAEFWLAEADRVLDEAEDDDPHRLAQLAAGAAMMLHSLATTFQVLPDHVFATDSPYWRYGRSVQVHDKDIVARLTLSALNLVASAAELEPENPYWPRLWAMLLGGDFPDGWRETLRDYAARDPGNALYDNVAASHLLFKGARRRREGRAFVMDIVDETMVSEGWDYFDAGLSKPKYVTLASWEECILVFLESSAAPRTKHDDYLRMVGSFSGEFEALRANQHTLRELADREDKLGHPRIAFEIRMDELRMLEQYAGEPGNIAAATFQSVLAHQAMDLRTVAHDNVPTPVGRFDPNDVEWLREKIIELDELAHRSLTESQLLSYAEQELQSRYPPAGRPKGRTWNTQDVAWFLVIEAPATLSLLLSISILGLVCSWNSKPVPRSFLGSLVAIAGHVIAWIVAVALSFLMFGYLPSLTNGEDIQEFMYSIAALSVVGLALIAALWNLLRRSEFRFRLGTLLVAVTVAAVLMLVLVEVVIPLFSQWFPFPLHVSRAEVNGWHVKNTLRVMITGDIRDVAMTLEWLLQSGPTAAVMIWMLILLAASLFSARRKRRKVRQRHANRESDQANGTRKSLPAALGSLGIFRELSRRLARGALIMFVLSFCAYAWILPSLLREHAQQFDDVARQFVDDTPMQEESAAILQDIRADEETMAEIRAFVEDSLLLDDLTEAAGSDTDGAPRL